jgi:hypothetical protein
MGKAGKSTKRFTGTIDGLNNTYSNLSAKLGLVGGAMTILAKSGTVLAQSWTLLTASGDKYLGAVDSIQETMTTLPFGLGEAARASFEFGEALGIASSESRKKMKALRDMVKDVRDELQGVNKDIWKQTRDIQDRSKWTRLGRTDTQISDAKKRADLIELAADKGGAAYQRALERIEAKRQKIEDQLTKGGMDWGDAYDKSTAEVNAVRTSIVSNERAKVELARAQLFRQDKDKTAADEAAHESNMQKVFRDRLKFTIDTRLGKDAGAEAGAMSGSKEDMRKVIAKAYREAVNIAQGEQAKVDLAKKLGVGVSDLLGMDPDKLRRELIYQDRVSMSDLDKRADTEVGRMLIAAEHVAKIEGDRIKQEREGTAVAATKAKQQDAEVKRSKQLVSLTKSRTTAERDLLNVQRMAMGDQFTFTGVVGTMRIADKGDTQRLQLAQTEALERVNRTLLTINNQLEGMAT